MAFSKDWSECWRHLLDLSPNETIDNTLDLLQQRYVEEMQRIDRFKQHAERMHYPQYRDKFLQMAQETSRHVAQLGEKIVALGGHLPDVAQPHFTDENSWQSLSRALDEENRSADRLVTQLPRIESEGPDIAELVQHIFHEQAPQRRAIQDMLMRSDPFAQSLA